MPHDYYIDEHKHHNWFQKFGETDNAYTVEAKIEYLNTEQRTRFIKFVQELSDE